jgi:hypothetical protein
MCNMLHTYMHTDTDTDTISYPHHHGTNGTEKLGYDDAGSLLPSECFPAIPEFLSRDGLISVDVRETFSLTFG